jgi:hypothetical protein
MVQGMTAVEIMIPPFHQQRPSSSFIFFREVSADPFLTSCRSSQSKNDILATPSLPESVSDGM